MAKPPGPIDDTLKKLIEFVAARRASAYSAWSKGDREEFRDLIAALRNFVFKVGYFATPHIQAIDAAYDAVVCDLRARLGKLSWLMSTPLIMKVICRDHSMSGWMFQQLRERIQVLTTDGPPLTPSPLTEQEIRRRLDEVAPAFVPLRSVHSACELKRHKRNKQLERQGFCGWGCDILMLEYLKFPPILIGRVLGLKEGTTRNRLESCRDHLRTVKQRLNVVALQND